MRASPAPAANDHPGGQHSNAWEFLADHVACVGRAATPVPPMRVPPPPGVAGAGTAGVPPCPCRCRHRRMVRRGHRAPAACHLPAPPLTRRAAAGTQHRVASAVAVECAARRVIGESSRAAFCRRYFPPAPHRCRWAGRSCSVSRRCLLTERPGKPGRMGAVIARLGADSGRRCSLAMTGTDWWVSASSPRGVRGRTRHAQTYTGIPEPAGRSCRHRPDRCSCRRAAGTPDGLAHPGRAAPGIGLPAAG